nr:hypothetical protein [uncultured Roseococcus sp.]
MSTTFSYDDLHIQPRPRLTRMAARRPLSLVIQLPLAAAAGFILAWALARFLIG